MALTAREHQVLRLMATGSKNQAIAERLCVSDAFLNHAADGASGAPGHRRCTSLVF
jgi:FixJ family two-component response regulator